MAELVFVDTNVLLYALDGRDAGKQVAASAWVERLWSEGRGRLSWQVLHEFYTNAVKKLGATPNAARRRVELLSLWLPVENTLVVTHRAWHWSDEAQLSHWDALIVAAAERTSCRWLLSEDFQDGRMFGSLEVVNPFTHPVSGIKS